MSSPRSLQLLSRAAVAGMTVVVGLVVVAILARALLLAALSAESLTYGQVATYLAVQAPVALALFALLVLVSLGTAAAFLGWLYRAHRNLSRLAGVQPPAVQPPAVQPRWARRWVFLAWLVPVANIALPAAVVADVARASAVPAAVRLVWGWWAGFAGSLLWTGWLMTQPTTSRGFGYMYGSPSERVDPALRAELVAFFGQPAWTATLPVAGLLLIGAVFGALLVRTVTAAQHALLERAGNDDSPPPPA